MDKIQQQRDKEWHLVICRRGKERKRYIDFIHNFSICSPNNDRWNRFVYDWLYLATSESHICYGWNEVMAAYLDFGPIGQTWISMPLL